MTRMTAVCTVIAIPIFLAAPGCLDEPGGAGTSGLESSGVPWTPPPGSVGAPGWRASVEPWRPPVELDCGTTFGHTPFDVWSDPAGVYVLYGWTAASPYAGGGYTIDGTSLAVSFNGGSGWSEPFRETWEGADGMTDSAFTRLGGILDGRLLAWRLYGSLLAFGDGASEPYPEVQGLGDLFVVHERLAYAVWTPPGDGPGVIRYDGSGWSRIPAVFPYDGADGILWADDDDVFFAAASGLVLSLEDGAWRVHDTGTLRSFTALWGFDGDDVRLGDDAGGLHRFDGATWSEVAWASLEDGEPCDWPSAVRGAWGADGVLYFATRAQFARWDAAGIEVLGHWPGTYALDETGEHCAGGMQPVALWGNAPDEVFLAVAEPSFLPDYYCDDVALLRWDGAAFHQF